MRPEVAAAHVPVRPGQPENGKPFKNVGGAAEARNQLGGYGGDGSPRGSHAEPQDQRQVQRNVQYAGQNQEIEGRPAVPEGAENVGEEVEQHGCADAPGNDDDVGVGRLHDFRRSLQQFQNGTSKGDADGGQQDGHDGTQDDADGKAAPHRPPAARSKALGRDDSQPRCESDDEAEDEKHQAARAAHGGQGFHAQRAAHDQGVRHVVKLLEQVADQQGNGKQENQFGGIAACQGLGHPERPHGTPLPCFFQDCFAACSCFLYDKYQAGGESRCGGVPPAGCRGWRNDCVNQ